MNKYKIIALCGESGAGKDRTLEEICRLDSERFIPQFNKIINCTTRPPREGEVNGVHYYFISPSEFTTCYANDMMLETTEHRNWFYGTSLTALSKEKTNIGVFNPIAIDILSKDPRVDILVYKIAASPKTRLLRQLNRQQEPDVDEIVRRYGADKKDFANMQTSYIELPNETEDDLWNNIVYLNQVASLGKID